MIRRLIEAHFDQFASEPNDRMIQFWLRESRSPAMLVKIAQSHPQFLQDAPLQRPWIRNIPNMSPEEKQLELKVEEERERKLDADYSVSVVIPSNDCSVQCEQFFNAWAVRLYGDVGHGQVLTLGCNVGSNNGRF